ncbi:MAG: YciI-like protein [Caldilinea sp.]
MYHILFYHYVEEILERRVPFRSEHLARIQAAHARGELVMAGALSNPVDQAVLIFRVADPQILEQFVQEDPYVQNGLVTAWQIRPWTVVVGG